MRIASGHHHSELEHVLHFLHKTCNLGSFWKFHVVVETVVQNNCKEMYKKVYCTGKVAFLLINPIVVFSLFSLPSPLSITRLYILFKQTINIIESFPFSPGTQSTEHRAKALTPSANSLF